MAWIIDTCVLLDIRIGQPLHLAEAAAKCLEQYTPNGLIICPISFVELSPSFRGNYNSEKAWLDSLCVSYQAPWLAVDTMRSHRLWYQHIKSKRKGKVKKRPVADVLIAAFAMRFQGIITRNETDFRSISPQLNIITP